MSQSTQTRRWGRTTPSSVAFNPTRLIAALALVVMIVTLSRVLPAPAHVTELKLVNTSPYAITVESSNGQGSWVTVGIAAPSATTSIGEVIDEGSTWAMRFTGQGIHVEGETVSRADLVAAGWQYTIPQSVGDELTVASAPPTPG